MCVYREILQESIEQRNRERWRGNCGDEGSGGVHGDEDDRLFTWVQLLDNDILIPILFTVLTLHPIQLHSIHNSLPIPRRIAYQPDPNLD